MPGITVIMPTRRGTSTIVHLMQSMPIVANALSIAGSDPSGGAGIQADLKTFSALGVYGAAVITGLTAQNTCGVRGAWPVEAACLAGQLDAVLDDLRIDAVKIGMLGDAPTASLVAGRLRRIEVPVVLDPVMVAKGGHALLEENALAVLRQELLPLSALLTPNLPEAGALLGRTAPRTREDMEQAAHDLARLGPAAVLVKGGHLGGAANAGRSPDLLLVQGRTVWLDGPRLDTRNTHGTGCTLSSAIAAGLARGAAMEDAVRTAKGFVTDALERADQLDVGGGIGPLNHLPRTPWRPDGG